jgi:membrane protein implicated in regulation of membrane protease activity
MGLLKDIVTLGASKRIEKRVNEFNIVYDKYHTLLNQQETLRSEINETFEKLIKTKISAAKSLNKIKKISKKFKEKDRIFLNKKEDSDINTYNFSRIDKTLSNANTALSLTGGISAGVGTAAGAWALASTIGFASTGTFIGSLSGVAATNATLAWLGGGALAAGGGGMAAGATVLGGLLVVPVIIVSGILSHKAANKKIKELDEKTIELNEAIVKIKENIPKLQLILEYNIPPSKKLIGSLEKLQTTFDLEFKRIYKQIYQYPVLSRLKKWTMEKIMRKNYFSVKDLEYVSYIRKIANDFAELIDTKVI